MNMTPKGFQAILDKFDRVALCGAVSSGKTLLLDGVKLDREVFNIDKWRINASFAEVPGVIVDQLQGVPRFVLSGMLAPHALRAGLEVDAVVWISQSRDQLVGPSIGLREMLGLWSLDNPDVPICFVDRAIHEGAG